jgi:3-phosphoshikimate 1-carboxyvinyltransferase
MRVRVRARGRRDAVVVASASSSSVAAPAAKAEEIVLQPIREISGAVQLPGSKSLSNRILLLSALSEVRRGSLPLA